MAFKYFVIILFAFILYNLAVGLIHILKNKRGANNKTVKALTWRVGISVFAFILLFIAQALGWIQAHNVLPPNP